MEQLLVALLGVAVVTTIFASNVAGSVLHGIAGVSSDGGGYPQLIPYQVAYSNLNSPIAVLSQLHGLTIDEALSAVAAGRNEADVPANETGQEQSPAPVSESSADSVDQQQILTQEQLYQQVFGGQLESSGSSNAIEEPASPADTSVVSEISGPPLESTGSVNPIEEAASPSEIPTTAGNPPPSEEIPQPEPATPPATSPTAPISISIGTAEKIPIELPEAVPTKSVGSQVVINAEEGKLHMQASLASIGREGIKVSIGDLPKLDVDSVPVIIPELPVSGIVTESKPPKGPTNVNVNVNVNVNGDGSGSVINSTSVADITASIKGGHKKCD